ncbi:hypothetical protein CMI45_02565 [Candidatus Pacearchaeota archaeon]|nr:hypothetical protein [Candidatus Pacearchaeota archaeon]|tara:strand:+ start:924 stop:1568 length:645 start_codon:yes stop_codon:yes gene_type:complete
MKVVPTVFAKNKKDFDSRFKKLIKVSKELQIDFMDGKFVKSKGVSLKDIPRLRGKGKFEAHLMVKNPGEWIQDLKKKGFSKVLVHYEAVKDIDNLSRIVFLIKSEKMKSWLVFNPETDFNRIKEVLSRMDIDGIMFMGVKPGKEGQKLDPNLIRKVSNVRNFDRKIKIQVDGGINDKNVGNLGKAGVDIVNVGSFVSQAKDPKKSFELLKKKAA